VAAGSYSIGASALDREYREEAIVLGEAGEEMDFTLDEESHPGRWTTAGNTLPEFLDAAGETQVSPPPAPAMLGVVKWCDLYRISSAGSARGSRASSRQSCPAAESSPWRSSR